jgi:selenocysteine-specific translation elongation factor
MVFIQELNKDLAETLVTLDLLEKENEIIVISDFVDEEYLKAIISKTSMKNYKIISNETIQIREEIYKLNEIIQKEHKLVPIDQVFSVKSVGTVILGFVKGKEIMVHDELKILPNRINCQVKSLQINDKNYNSAPTGCHVGLALKNVKAEDIERGNVLTDKELDIGKIIEIEYIKNQFVNRELKDSEQIQVNCGLQVVSGVVKEISDKTLIVELNKDIVIYDKLVLINNNLNPRIYGVSKNYKIVE